MHLLAFSRLELIFKIDLISNVNSEWIDLFVKESAKADISYAFFYYILSLLLLFGLTFVFILWDKLNWFEVCVCVCVLLLRYLYCYYNTNNSTENDIQILFVIIITLSIHHTLHSIHYIYVCVSYFFMSWVRAKISLSNLIIKSITYTSDLFWPFFPHCVCGKCMTFHSSAMTYSITSSRIVKFGK